MHPTFDLFFFEVPQYTALVMLGCTLGLITTHLYLRLNHIAGRKKFLDVALVVFIAAWIGARAYHVLLNWDYYAARPDEIAQYGLGGMAMRGAFILGAIACVVYARVRHVSVWHFADASALGLSLGQAMGWIGALIQGANYGVISDSRLALDLPDLYGLLQPRFPVQHFAIAFFALLFVGLLILSQRQPRPGDLFRAYLLLASIAQFLLGTQRGDETMRIGVWRVDQLVDAGLMLVAFVLFIQTTMFARSEKINVQTH